MPPSSHPHTCRGIRLAADCGITHNRRIMQRGFSLVELSIVLVIIGLLTGGILAGQSLIRAAELRSIVNDLQHYRTATQAFHDQYKALPGDLDNATQLWQRARTTSCTSYSGSAVGTPGTCDGNNDGILSIAPNAGVSGEMFEFWRQLALAGFITGNYTGMAGSSEGADCDFGMNCPSSRIRNAGWGSTYLDNSAGTEALVFALDFTNALTFGGDDTIYADTPILRVEEAWGIDTKLDDGNPGHGKVMAYPSGVACNTASDNTDFNATYKLSSTAAQACSLIFRR